jgi:phosphohistidine phosphatase SixA
MRAILSGISIVGFCTMALVGASVGAQADELKGDALFSALKSGGYILYFRHSSSDTSQNDADPIDVKNCATQRNLSDEGKAQAANIGKALKAIGAGIDRVLNSPYCRARDTAKLAFGTTEDSEALYYSLGLPKDGAAKAAAQLKEMLGKAPAAGKNIVMVGHTSNIKEVAGVWPKTEGGAFVLQPKGDGSFVVVGSFTAAELIKAGS